MVAAASSARSTAAAPKWPLQRVGRAALALLSMVEGAAALAAADPEAYPPAAQEAMLDAGLEAFGLSISTR
ncbi:hypothetical protein GCM10010170_017260 [Dactylosporangium salmoneum]|uniref:TetR family transcriptional regulator n=1 Tax=Dactylosporangium salmoneum TaxID=53361 RepID=A0ABN3FT57_9ACTN